MLSQTITDPRMPLPPYLLPSQRPLERHFIACPGERRLSISLPDEGQRQPVWSQDSATLVQGGTEGRPALHEQNGVFTVTDGDGNVRFTGNEIAAEFAYWQTTFGVPDEEETESEVVQ